MGEVKKREPRMKVNRYYLIILGIFLAFTAGSILIFFSSVQKQVEINARETINENVKRQSVHFQAVINTQMKYLSGIAAHIGTEEELFCEENLELIRVLKEATDLERVGIMNGSGVGHYDNGEEKLIVYRKYFRDVIRGRATVSNPVSSMMDGETKVVLCVPIWRGEQVIGALGGSYNVGSLSHMLFEDIYGGEGFSMIATVDGQIVALDGTEPFRQISQKDNIFKFYEEKGFIKAEKADQMRADFENQSSGFLIQDYEGDIRYMAYEPIGVNDWMLCYVVPRETAQESYQLIRKVEVMLYGVLLAGVILLLFFIWRINSRNQKILMKNAQTDLLTGVDNKRSAEVKVNQWIEEKECVGLQAFFMLDIDRFKEINDAYGHMAGDEALREVGKLLRSCFRGDDITGRIGGDEFVVLMKNISSAKQAVDRAEQLSYAMKRLRIRGMGEQQITCSIGISFYPQNGGSFVELYRCADKALYEVKRNGRDGCLVYEESSGQEGISAETG